MSMLNLQCAQLRKRANELRRFQFDLSLPFMKSYRKDDLAFIIRSTAIELEEAADTIEGLRERLQADVLRELCELTIEPWEFDPTMGDGELKPWKYCPECGWKAVKR